MREYGSKLFTPQLKDLNPGKKSKSWEVFFCDLPAKYHSKFTQIGLDWLCYLAGKSQKASKIFNFPDKGWFIIIRDKNKIEGTPILKLAMVKK